MSDLVLTAVDAGDVGGRAVLGFTRYPELAPFHVGSGDIDLLCAQCRFVLAARLTPHDTDTSMLIRCPRCGTYNDPARHADPAEGLAEGLA